MLGYDPQYEKDELPSYELYHDVRSLSTIDKALWDRHVDVSECGYYIEVKGMSVHIDEDFTEFTAWAVDSIINGFIKPNE